MTIDFSSPFGQIGINLLANFLYDIGRGAFKEESNPINAAILTTESKFATTEGLGETLRQWIATPEVSKVLNDYVQGLSSLGEVPIDKLADTLIAKTRFYLGDASVEHAREVIEQFIAALRVEYLKLPDYGLLHLANRQEATFTVATQVRQDVRGLGDALSEVREKLSSLDGLAQSLKAQVDRAKELIKGQSYVEARAVLTSLAPQLQRSPQIRPDVIAEVHKSLAKIAIALADEKTASEHLLESTKYEPDKNKNGINIALSLLLGGKSEQALSTLNALDASARSLFQFFAVHVSTLQTLGRYQEATADALSAPTNNSSEEADKSILIGTSLIGDGKCEEAIPVLRQACELRPTDPDALSALGAALAIPALIEHNRRPRPYFLLGQETITRLQESAGILLEACSHYESAGRANRAKEERVRRSSVLLELGRFEEAVSELSRLFQANPTDSAIAKYLGTAHLLKNEPRNAIKPLKVAIDGNPSPDSERLYFQSLLFAGEHANALEYAKSKATEPISKENRMWHLSLAEVYRANRQWTAAKEKLDSILSSLGESADLSFQFAEHYQSISDGGRAQACFQRALDLSDESQRDSIRYHFGRSCFDQKDYHKGKEILEPLIGNYAPSSAVEIYVVCCYNLRDFAGVLRIVEGTKREGHELTCVLAEVAAGVYENLSRLAEAAELYEYLADRWGNNARYLSRLAIVKLRQGQREKALEILDGSRQKLKRAFDLMAYAQAYAFLGRAPEALELGHLALQKSPTDPHIHFAYIHLFFTLEGSGVTDFEAKYSESLKDTLGNFEQRFPGNPFLRSISIGPDGDITPFLQQVDQLAERARTALDTYKSKAIPLQLFARMLGRDIYETWQSVVADKHLKMTAWRGTDEERKEYAETLANCASLVLDLTSLFTLGLVGCLNSICIAGKLHVAQRTLDELHELQHSRLLWSKGQGLFGKTERGYFLHEFTPEDIERSRYLLDSVTTFVEQKTVPLGLNRSLSKDEEKLAEMLGEYNLHTILLSAQECLPIVTDDHALASIGKHLYSVRSVCSQALLAHQCVSGKLDAETYDNAVLGLLRAGYFYVSIDAPQVVRLLSKHNYQINTEIELALQPISWETTTMQSATYFVAEFLMLVFLEPLPAETRASLTVLILNALTHSRPTRRTLSLLRRVLRRRMSFLLFMQLRLIENTILAWEKSQLIVT